MRKLSFSSSLAAAFAGVLAAASVPCLAGEEAPCDEHGAPHSKAMFTRPGHPIHTKDYAGDHPAPLPEGCHGDGSLRYSSPLEAWLSGDQCARTYSPDYGWSRPVKRPVLNRIPVQYYRMDPDFWYGDPRAFQGAYQFPTVYMPTDTTQLGFSYARVPTWQPNPAMLPAPPWPSVYHRRECPGYRPPELPKGTKSCQNCLAARCDEECCHAGQSCPHCGQVHGTGAPTHAAPRDPNEPLPNEPLPNAPPPTPVDSAPKGVEKSAVRMIPNGLTRR